MSQYLISVWHAPGVHAEGAAYASEDAMRLAFERVAAFNDALQSTDALVAAGGLTPPEEAVVVDATAVPGPEVVTAQMRVAEGTASPEGAQLGGFWIVIAPDDDAARILAGRASYACGQPVELRLLQG